MIPLRPDPERIRADLEALANFVEPALPGYTRRSFTPVYFQAREWLGAQMAAAGLAVTTDAAGNLIGRLDGERADLPPILIGSHTDTVVGGGRFDGMVGVVGAVEVVRCLQAAGHRLVHSLEVVDFLAEEPTEYGVSTVGSRGMVGALSPAMLSRINPAGERLDAAIRRAGGEPEQLSEPLRRPGEVAAFVELHIEQGPVLWQRGLSIGVVTGIAGIKRYQVAITGSPNHAGTTPMDVRRDALAAAAELVLAVEAICRAPQGAPLVGTVGRITVHPNAPNVVPGSVELFAEMRSISQPVLDGATAAFEDAIRRLAAARGVDAAADLVSTAAPAPVSPAMQDRIAGACDALGLSYTHLPSGAGHDAMHLATIAPMGMIFVPSVGGRSHCPEEWTDWSDVAAGVAALLEVVRRLDSVDPRPAPSC
ncbi:MAG: Zn-dependent hydrolase [Chloroflexi bacterium]|nr:Zn-dependent hydrolase [Chloroflexota bacterium]